MNKVLNQMLNDQMNHEIFTSHSYLQLSFILSSKGYSGLAKRMRNQSNEEKEHSDLIYDFINDLGGEVKISTIIEPVISVEGLLDSAQLVYSLEHDNTNRINNILKIARENNEYMIEVFLLKLVEEQIEEEKWSLNLVDRIKACGDNKAAFLLIDKEFLNT